MWLNTREASVDVFTMTGGIVRDLIIERSVWRLEAHLSNEDMILRVGRSLIFQSLLGVTNEFWTMRDDGEKGGQILPSLTVVVGFKRARINPGFKKGTVRSGWLSE